MISRENLNFKELFDFHSKDKKFPEGNLNSYENFFKINEVFLESKSYLFKDNKSIIKNEGKKLRKKVYQLGDTANVEKYLVISPDHVKKENVWLENDSYEEAFLEVFLPIW